jgi:predicted PurR-regulated permease PerM
VKLDEKLTKKIIFLTLIAMAFLWVVLNWNTAIDIVEFVFGLLKPLILGLCIAFILNVPMRFFEERLVAKVWKVNPEDGKKGHIQFELRRGLCLLLTIALVLGVVTLVLVMIIPSLKDTITSIISHAPSFWNKTESWVNKTLKELNIDQSIQAWISENTDKLLQQVLDFLKNIGPTIAQNAAGAAMGVFSAVANIVFGFVLALYILLTKETLGRQTRQAMFAYVKEPWHTKLSQIADLSKKTFEKFVAGQCLEAVIIGALTTIGCLVINAKYAYMLGVLVGFTALIPVIGAFIGVIIGALLLVMVNPWQALAFIIFIIVLQQLENHIIYPKVVGKSIGLPGMWVLLAVLIGASVGGFVGILIGVPVSSVLYVLIRESIWKRLRKKKETETEETDIA